ncbi:alpha/beta hydrolase family protein [Spirosoma pollinicola]|uniref:Phospholipase n=1 Tax=Spirosoma pollinicola TaxID=2057025 RepID=A0A2K8YYU4_9BACT|nr:lipase family protein [Spirosoma pollinicola]AUD02759.1 phospholipase [Spirosoma pollinicola]
MKLLTVLKTWRSVSVALFVVVYITGCSSATTDPQPTADQYLVSSTDVATLTKEQLVTQASAVSPLYALLLRQGVSAVKLVYKTTNWDGSSIQASGLLIIPATTEAVPMISEQHGTIFDDVDAPSNFGPGSEAYQYATIFSSIGYIIACPDYIGFGASKNLPHTYEHRASQAQASLDMLRAAREYIKAHSAIKWDSRLYLAGYSEGGFATMALYKKMQEEVPTEFNLRAVSCGAGAYDKTNFMKALLTQPSAGVAQWNRAFLWVLLTYDQIYKLNRPLSFYFKEPYLTDIQKNRQLATVAVSFDQILTDSFKAGILSGTDTAFLNAVADNNIYDWKPLTTLHMYHGDADPQVYYLNSKNAYDAMQARGAGKTVQLFTSVGKTHVQTIPDWLAGTYTLFSSVQ